MSTSNIIGVPSDDKAFEENCVPLFAKLLSDPNVKLVGTRGKGQSGIDLIGRRDRDAAQPVGIQCKLITRGGKLTEAIIRSEAAKALTIIPHLTEFFIVTTARDDLAYDKIANTIAQEQSKLGRKIDVQVWGWDTLEPKIRGDKASLDAFDPGHSASTDRTIQLGEETLAGTNQINEKTDQMLAGQNQLHVMITAMSTDAGRSNVLEAHLDVQSDNYRDILNAGKPQTALDLLEKLQCEITDGHSKAIRARVRANIGIAQQRLGNDVLAGELLLEAYDIHPEDSKVSANRILGFQLLGRFDESLGWAKTCLELDPQNASAAAFVFQAATLMPNPPDPFELVPVDLLDDFTVRIYRINYLRQTASVTEWQALAIETWQSNPDDIGICRIAGEAFLDKAIGGDGYERSPRISSERTEDLLSAEGLLLQYWNQVRKYENADQNSWLIAGCNLMTVYRALRRTEDAARVRDQILALNPSDPDVCIAAAHLAMDDNDHKQTLELIQHVPDNATKTVIMLHALSLAEDWKGILDYASDQRRSALGEKFREQYDTMLFRARHASDESLDVDAEADALVEKWPASMAALVTLADIYRRTDTEKFETIFGQAQKLLETKVNYGHRLMFDQLAHFEENWPAVIEALDGFVPTDVETEALGWLALAFANAPSRQRSSAFFKSLAPELSESARFARLAGATEHNRGDVKAAQKYLRVAIADDPTDLRAHLLLQSAFERNNRSSEASTHICGVDENKLTGHPMDQMRLAQLLRRFGATERALMLGFKIVSTNRDDRAVASSYPGLIFASEQLPASVGNTGVAKKDIWFRLAGQDGEKDVEGILSSDAVTGATHFSPDHPMAIAVEGRAIGEAVSLPQKIGPDLKYTIAELKHKYVWLLHDIMATHGSRFPDETSMFSLTMKEGDVQPILDMVKDMDQRGRSIIDVYLENPIPLCAVAAMAHKKVVAMADHLPMIGEEIRTCTGLLNERENAERLVETARDSNAVMDTLTVWRAQRLGILAPLKKWFGALYIPQSTFDELLEMRSEAEMNLGREYMTLSSNENGQMLREQHSTEEIQSVRDLIDSAISDVQKYCTVMPVDGADDLALGPQFEDAPVDQLIDPILLARSQNCILLSDELNLREFAAQFGADRGAWLQIVLRKLAANQLITDELYAIATARLAVARHGHISLDAQMLISILTSQNNLADQYFESAIHYIGGPKAEMISHINVAQVFMLMVWDTPLPNWKKGRAIGLALTGLIKGRTDWLTILHVLESNIRQLARSGPRAGHAYEYLVGWIRGHFFNLDDIRKVPLAISKTKRKRI